METAWCQQGAPSLRSHPRKDLLGFVAQCLEARQAGQDDLTGNSSKFKLSALIPGAKTPPGRPPHSMSTPGSPCRWLSPLPHPTPPLGPPVRLPTAPLLAFHLLPQQSATMLYSLPHQPSPQLLLGSSPTAHGGRGPSQCRVHPQLEIHPHGPSILGFPTQDLTRGETEIARGSRHRLQPPSVLGLRLAEAVLGQEEDGGKSR